MTLDEFIEGNRSRNLHYFDKETMRFFNSTVVKESWGEDGYFITGEHRLDYEKPRYSIRKGDLETFQVKSVGEFQQYETKREAKVALKKIRTGVEDAAKT